MRPNSQVAQLGLLGLGLFLLLAVFGCGSGSQEGSPNYDTQLEQPAESPMQNRPPCVGADGFGCGVRVTRGDLRRGPC